MTSPLVQTSRILLLSLLLACAPATPVPTVDGAEIHWSSRGDGPGTVIFVHGWTCDETSWSGQLAAIGKTHRVITLDLPGHGRSGMPADGTLSMDRFARAVEAVRHAAGVEQAVLVGHSMGTPVVRRYALTYPERVSALVLVDGLVIVPGGEAFTPPSLVGEEGLKAREALIRSMFGPSTSEPLRQRILEMMLGPSEAAADGAMAATFDTSGISDDPVTVPVLAIYADESGLADREGMKHLYPMLEYHEIPETGHFLMMEKPEAFNRLLADFLSGR